MLVLRSCRVGDPRTIAFPRGATTIFISGFLHMSNFGKPVCCLILGVAALLVAEGCYKSPSGPSPAPVASKPTPEQSFEQIVETVKRRIQDTPSGFVMKQPDGASSRLMASNTVTSEIFPPTKEGEPYRGEVTIASESRYSLQRSGESSDESSKKRDSERSDQKSGSDTSNQQGGTGSG